MKTPEEIQKEYYSNTSNEYDELHLTAGNDPEHDFALAFLRSCLKLIKMAI